MKRIFRPVVFRVATAQFFPDLMVGPFPEPR